jgi:hypothetical protein
MTRSVSLAVAALAGAALTAALLVAPAEAQVTRTFVSAAGSDSNNCANVATPCRHLANAYVATAANGEIYVLDPANYGSLTITGPVSIEGHGWASIAPPSNGDAITINAHQGDKINIIGVVLDGTNVAGTIGIHMPNGGASLTIRDSVIRNFSEDGILFAPTAGPSQLFVFDTLITDNRDHGIEFNPHGAGTYTGVLNRVDMENNQQSGFSAEPFTTNITMNVTVSDSVSSNNGTGLQSIADLDFGSLVSVMVRNCTIANNSDDGLFASSPGARLWVTRSTITGNANGWLIQNGGSVASYDDNNIAGNNASEGAPPPIGYK